MKLISIAWYHTSDVVLILDKFYLCTTCSCISYTSLYKITARADYFIWDEFLILLYVPTLIKLIKLHGPTLTYEEDSFCLQQALSILKSY